MDDFEDDCNSNGGENWIQSQKYTNWEIECINRLETSPDLEQQIEVEKGGNYPYFRTKGVSFGYVIN